ELTNLRQGRDRLSVPTPARRQMCCLQFELIVRATEEHRPFQDRLVFHVAIKKRMRTDQCRLLCQRMLYGRVIRRSLRVQYVAVVYPVGGKIPVKIPQAGQLLVERGGGLAARGDRD